MNEWTYDGPNPVLTEAAESMLAVGLRDAKRLVREGDVRGAHEALAVAISAAELLDEATP